MLFFSEKLKNSTLQGRPLGKILFPKILSSVLYSCITFPPVIIAFLKFQCLYFVSIVPTVVLFLCGVGVCLVDSPPLHPFVPFVTKFLFKWSKSPLLRFRPPNKKNGPQQNFWFPPLAGISPLNAIWKTLICLGHSLAPLLQMGGMESWVEKMGGMKKIQD